MIHFKAWCHICRIPAHVFKPNSILRFNARKRILKAGKCTLMDAFGRQNSDGLGGSTVKGKGTPVLGSGIFPKTWGDVQSSQTYSPSETFHHKRFPTPQISLIRGKTALMFSGILHSGAHLAYPGLNRRRKSPLIAPIGRRNSRGLGGWHGQEERKAVLEQQSR